MADQIPPQSIEAEENVIGAMLISPIAIERVAGILDASDFYRESHAKLYRAAVALWGSGTPVDAVTLTAEMEKRGEIEEIGGRVRIHELSLIVPASANAAHYAEIVREHSFRRGLIRAGGEIAQLGWEWEGEAADRMMAVEELLDQLRSQQRGAEEDENASLLGAAEYLDEKFRNPPDESDWVRAPFSFINQRLGPGRLYVLGGYPADGKTSIGLQFFLAAAHQKKRTELLTLEMSLWDVTERLASVMGLPPSLVTSGRYATKEDDREKQKNLVRAVLGKMTELAPYGSIWDSPAADIPAIRARVKAVRPELLVVDHLHQFRFRAEYERQDLEATVQGLWQIAREFNTTILLLAQLSRSGDKRHPFPPPTMSALKGSGAIEQLAWAVWFVYRLRNENNLPTNEAQFICAKNRSGVTGTRRLDFDSHHIRFLEIQREG